MASVLNRTTKQYLASVNTPDYPSQDWIVEPNLSAVIGFDSRYWIVTGDVVTLMNQGQRDALDVANMNEARDSLVTQLDNLEEISRATLLSMLDEFNLHALRINAILNAVDGSTTLANLKTAVAAIADYPQRTTAQLRTAIRGKLGS